MIVKMTPELQDKYREYFAEIAARVAAVGGEGADVAAEVNSLPTYYRALDFLAASGAAANNKKFFRIPLDEKPITIDLSTRKINIKDSAYKDSIGVAGDTNAELIFFESDRFFDVTDLAACNYILIQWSNDDGKTYHQEYGILQDFTDDKYDENDNLIESAKVLFGWLVGKDVAAAKGKIRFNVRFCITNNNNEIVFDLNTEPAEAMILNSLVPDINTLPIEPDHAEHIVFSRPIYGTIINSMEGATPIIEQNLVSGIQHLDKQYPNTDGKYALSVKATSPDQGAIVYEWYKSGTVITDNAGNKWALGQYDAIEAGSYWVRIGNQTTNGTRTLISPTVQIPAAGAIEIKNAVIPTRAYSPAAASDSRQAPEAWVANMSVTMYNDDIEKRAYPAVLQYQWYKNVVDEAAIEDKEAIITINKIKYAPIKDANSNTYVPEANAEGLYFCEIINHLNNTQSAPIRTSVSEIRAYPQNLAAPKIELVGKELVCRLQGKVPSDLSEIRYQWNRNDIGDVPARAGGTNDVYDLSAYVLAEGTYDIKCYVAHEVFAGTTVAAISDRYASVSNSIVIKVTKNAQGTFVYEQV